jgi:tripartite-type tricarboxylate transporter receptor subunit TctC
MASWPWTDSWYLSSTVGTAAALLIGASVAAASTEHGAENRAASGENYPSKPVRFISPFSAGGGTDVVARALAQRMSEAIGRPFVVDNRGGAEGVIGTDLGAKAPPDGYTLLVANLGTFCLTPNLRKVSYDPLKDFAPITQTTASSTVLVVHPSVVVHTVKELVALAKAKPGQLNCGASSNGTALPMEMLKQMAGIGLNDVPYTPSPKSGTPSCAQLRSPAIGVPKRCPKFPPLPKQAFRGMKRTAGTASSRPPARRVLS